ncbi:MAG: hypothetical protein LBT02_03350 [Rickettsiales bacterium]|jgi:hypothetical protein|nr:hypothetical protein [Rickettsiales bacterium]
MTDETIERRVKTNVEEEVVDKNEIAVAENDEFGDNIPPMTVEEKIDLTLKFLEKAMEEN